MLNHIGVRPLSAHFVTSGKFEENPEKAYSTAPCRREARRVPGQAHGSESVCPGCEGGPSVGEGFCYNLSTAPDHSSELGEGSSLRIFPGDQ